MFTDKFIHTLNNETPDQGEARRFWSDIWSKEVEHNKDAEWLEDFRHVMSDTQQQEKIEITVKKVQKMVQKIPNWKATGPDMVQGYWFKNFRSIHTRLKECYRDCLNNGQVPTWMTKERTVLLQKDKAKGNDFSNYRPITCLPLAWKILTGITG